MPVPNTTDETNPDGVSQEAPERIPVLMAGVVPPPFHGQSIATRALFDADLNPIEKVTVEIRSSQEISEVGKPSLRKLTDLFGVITEILRKRFAHNTRVLYYTAGSGAWVPFARDLLILGICRPFFRRTVIHYHSGDLLDFLRIGKLRGILGRIAYGRGAWSIRLGEGCPVPGIEEGADRVIDIPNGIDAPQPLLARSSSSEFRILFLGNLFEEKGVLEVIEAVRRLANDTSGPIRLDLVGAYPDQSEKDCIETALRALPSNVTAPTPAPAYGEAKWEALRNTDVLVFPSRYRRENLPLVIIEAMAAGLPVIATAWRGIPALVQEGQTGFLVPPRDPGALADAINRLVRDPRMREMLGKRAREQYRAKYTAGGHETAMREALISACQQFSVHTSKRVRRATNFGDLSRALARVFGSTIRDVDTGETLGKAMVFSWRGRVHVIGYTGAYPLRPVVLPSKRLGYWKTTLGFAAPTEPDYPNVR